MSLRRIALTLNEMGLRTDTGERFYAQTVKNIVLRNSTITK
ncbi:recombinase family protein [Alteromonas sp. P256]